MSTEATIAPVRKSVTVDRPVEDAFRLFTAEMATWWPLRTHSVAEDSTETVVFEPREGGRVYERNRDGSISYWADVTEWEPPHRFVLAWRPNPDAPAATELEVAFNPEGDRTRINLEHRGWERLGAAADEKRTEYDTGWDGVLMRYGQASRSNGLAIASLVVGVASLIVPFVGLVGAVVGFVFGVVAHRRAQRGAPHAGIAIAGIVVSTVALVIWAVALASLTTIRAGDVFDDGPIVTLEETPAP